MTGYGRTYGMMSGFGGPVSYWEFLLETITWLLVIAALTACVRYFWKKGNGK